jgi:hypothetical protein
MLCEQIQALEPGDLGHYIDRLGGLACDNEAEPRDYKAKMAGLEAKLATRDTTIRDPEPEY